MRVLLVNPYDYGRGGGPIAMYRLHRGLRKAGVDSKLLCKYKKLESPESVAIPHSFAVGAPGATPWPTAVTVRPQ